jgi:hypothetical protein
MDITLYATGVDVAPTSGDTLMVGLEEVDLSQLVIEVGPHDLLEEIGEEQIQEYLKDKAESAEAERQL